MKFNPQPKPEKTPPKAKKSLQRKKPLWKNKRIPFSKQIATKAQQTKREPDRSKLEKILDHLFSKHVRKKDADAHGYTKCFTCPKRDHWKNLQCGHFITRNNRATRWDEDNCRPQCATCNMANHGMTKEFARRLGPDLVMLLDVRAHGTAKFSSGDLLEMIKKYETSLK